MNIAKLPDELDDLIKLTEDLACSGICAKRMLAIAEKQRELKRLKEATHA